MQAKNLVEKIEQDRKALSVPDKPQLVLVGAVGVPAPIGTLEQCFLSEHKTTHRFGILEQVQAQAFSPES
jgi:hypothetical protein